MDTVARTQIRDMLYYAVFVLVFTFALLFNRNDQRTAMQWCDVRSVACPHPLALAVSGIFHFTHNLEEHLLHTEMEFSAAHVEKTYFDISSVEEWWVPLPCAGGLHSLGAVTYRRVLVFECAAGFSTCVDRSWQSCIEPRPSTGSQNSPWRTPMRLCPTRPPPTVQCSTNEGTPGRAASRAWGWGWGRAAHCVWS